jgi:histidine ammonia-lyase
VISPIPIVAVVIVGAALPANIDGIGNRGSTNDTATDASIAARLSAWNVSLLRNILYVKYIAAIISATRMM